jgi:drug/metabolite transporter (DMT)-like permease
MLYLWLVSLVWAFSFGLIKEFLPGVDPCFVAFARIFLASLVFVPLLRPRGISPRQALQFMGVGAIQYGVMYLLYLCSYRYLQAYEVALFTIFTPLYVTLIHDLMARRFHRLHLFVAVLAVAGTAVINLEGIGSPHLVYGFLLLQGSNLCFAGGQVAYRNLMRESANLKDHRVFGLLFLGALAVTGCASGIATEWSLPVLTVAEALVLLYLGVLPAGLGFFLWNFGARKVNAGTLAVLNNVKVPLAVAVSLLVFGGEADLLRLLVGGGLLLVALWMNERWGGSDL